MVRGDEQDDASVEQAARILEMVEKASAQQAEQRVGAAEAGVSIAGVARSTHAIATSPLDQCS